MSMRSKKIVCVLMICLVIIISCGINTYAVTPEEELIQVLNEYKDDLGDINEFKKVIDKVYNQLNDEYKLFFDWNYKKCVGVVKTCIEVNISERTYYNMRDKIVYNAGMEMGLI